jgi:hypothetical protein
MRTTGIFTLHRFEIDVKKIGETINLIPFGDVHRDSPMCHVEKWKEFLDWGKSKKNCIFLGMGDYNDLASTSERALLGNKLLHESTQETLEGLYKRKSDEFVKEISFMRGKLIGLIEGNHYAELSNGTTSTQRMCDALNVKYLGVMSIIRLAFNYGRQRTSVDIVAHHGRGAGRMLGGSLNGVQKMAETVHANIYLQGDDHRKLVGMTTKLEITSSRSNVGGINLLHKKQLFLRTGSFLKGHEDGRASYIVDANLNPTDLGVVKIEMTPKRERVNRDGFYIDLHASI